ncbi:hypothetical protein [Dyella sp. OK004]|uniref:hypothetical protein n=1 Tax=Dyella sp. OK004 TaxID=1855292 RepID=UPI000B8549B6|nr:hypothetical protein [Dyella sp. OK004]
MSSHQPLLTRLRRRLSGAGWLFALLMVLKLAMGTACLAADGGQVDAADGARTVLVEPGKAVAQDDGAASCWHDGAGGCHCNCTHATPLMSDALMTWPALQPAHAFIAMQSRVQSLPALSPLRPPIA